MELRQTKEERAISKEEWNWQNVEKTIRSTIEFTIKLCPNLELSHLIQLFELTLSNLKGVSKWQDKKIDEENKKRFEQKKIKRKGNIILDLHDEYMK